MGGYQEPTQRAEMRMLLLATHHITAALCTGLRGLCGLCGLCGLSPLYFVEKR